MNLRTPILAALGLAVSCLVLAGPATLATPDAGRSMVILGIDGMDPELLESFMDAGLMPHFERLRDLGDYRHLGTSVPPQSPVAWSNFITGLDSGGHGIFDFIHRDPQTMLPYLSTARVEGESGRTMRLGHYAIPLASPRTVNLRDGRAFWELLEDQGVPATIFKVPANYPPTEFDGVSLSGMGTPDLLGTPGTFSYFTDDPAWHGRTLEGGAVYPVTVEDHIVESALHGPANTFVRVPAGELPPDALCPFTVWMDPEHDVARIELGDSEVVLQTGEWSPWLVADFELVPGLAQTSGICRLYLMETRPHFRLYVTPLNLNPADPAQPISTPADFAKHLYERVGFYYTQGMPEDTKALSSGVFDDADFVQQATLVRDERLMLLDEVLDEWDGEGFLFFYFSSVDQQSHMLWRFSDPGHPAYEPELVHRYANVLTHTYVSMDKALGQVMDRIGDDTTLIVMSDHGFASFRRAVHLNRWLADEGYLVLKRPLPRLEEDPNIFMHVDWSKTRAYALGINMLYINVQGRERRGIVPPGERRILVDEIAQKLLAFRDPETGAQAVTRIYPREEVYRGPHVKDGPDLVVGYAPGYRASWQTALGQVPDALVVDNNEKWSGDHCMDHTAVPGVVLANRPITHPDPSLIDITATVLDAFGVMKPGMMAGRSIFATDPRSAD